MAYASCLTSLRQMGFLSPAFLAGIPGPQFMFEFVDIQSLLHTTANLLGHHISECIRNLFDVHNLL